MIIFLATVIIGLCFYAWTQKNSYTHKLNESKRQVELNISELNHLKSEVSQLEKYRSILDIEKETELLKSQNMTLLNEMSKLRKDTNVKMEQWLKEANDSNENLRIKANIEYSRIIKEAEEKAKSIAGEAYEALKQVDRLEKAAKALKNVIEGYGDEYIIPTTSLLDNLAEEYSHTQAGEDLKKSRERMRSMVKAKTAAECDYVEEYRKQTAIDFVLDAFNGKIDTIIASVKEDNFGTLSQKIRDAFYTVNTNGAAFRNARITEVYLNTRLEELKLACTVQALKERDKEEQRRIKEQLREEEKAAKEYERALKEAQKDQESVNKAIDKIKKDMEAASEAKRLVFEDKLKELELKLKEAEEKNKRAQSMAELTRSGHVYIISNVGSFGDDVLKIGMTRRLEPMDRIYELGDASVPFDFDVHAMIYSEDAPSLEKELHAIFAKEQVNKVNPRKEFFKLGIMEIKDAVEKKGFQVHWTMQAEAREFRESLVIGSANKKVA